jgi:hypothetical protein
VYDVKKTLLQFAVLFLGVAGFALLLDQVIDLADEIPPIAAQGEVAAPIGAQVAVASMDTPADGGPVAPVVGRAEDDTVAALAPDLSAPGGPDRLVIDLETTQTAIRAALDPNDVRPKLDHTQDRWVTVRPFWDRDYLYFATLLTHRCGLLAVQYGLNGDPAETDWPMEPCHVGSLEPNAMLQLDVFPAYVTFAPDTIQQVSVRLTYADGSTEGMLYLRAQILQP